MKEGKSHLEQQHNQSINKQVKKNLKVAKTNTNPKC